MGGADLREKAAARFDIMPFQSNKDENELASVTSYKYGLNNRLEKQIT